MCVQITYAHVWLCVRLRFILWVLRVAGGSLGKFLSQHQMTAGAAAVVASLLCLLLPVITAHCSVTIIFFFRSSIATISVTRYAPLLASFCSHFRFLAVSCVLVVAASNHLMLITLLLKYLYLYIIFVFVFT